MKRLILSVVLVSAILLVAVTKVNAAGSTLNIYDGGSYNVPVTAEIVPTFTITLPNEISINERSVKEFEIYAKGTPRRSETLYINIPNKLEMTQNDSTVELNFAMDRNKFFYQQLAGEGTSTQCRIDASTLPSGNWQGSLEVEVQLKDFEVPSVVQSKGCILAYRNNSTGLATIYTMEIDKRFVYNESSNTLGNDCLWGPQYGLYQEQADGSFTFVREGPIVEEVINLSGNTMIYSNYNIEKNRVGSGEIWFEVTQFS